MPTFKTIIHSYYGFHFIACITVSEYCIRKVLMLLAGSIFLLCNEHTEVLSMIQPGPSEMKCFQLLREFAVHHIAHVSTICSGSVLEKCVLAKGFMRLLLGRGGISFTRLYYCKTTTTIKR